MIVHTCRQGSAEWENLRVGIPTASRFGNIITPTTGELSKSSKSYAYELIAEIILKRPAISGSTQWMERGNILEAEAIRAYSMINDVEVQRVGFITDDNHYYGCSPDGLIGKKRLLEVKCLAEANHTEFLFEDKIDPKHKPQVMGQLFIAECEENDWFGYYPGLPPAKITTPRDEPYIAKLSVALDNFREMMNEKIELAIQRGYIDLPHIPKNFMNNQTILSAG